MSDRLYCSLAELLADLDQPGAADEAAWLRYIRAASDYIDKEIGWFVPVTQTRAQDGNGRLELPLDWPLLAITSLTDDGVTLTEGTDFLKYPRTPKWQNGPCTRLVIDPDATGISAWTHERDAVQIAGRWGLYEETVPTGQTVTLDNASDGDLTVANGAAMSPGMVLLVESEQMLVESAGAATNATSLLNGAVTLTADTIVVDDGSEFFAGETLQVDTEDMKVLKKNGNTLYVARGINGTIKAAHNNDAQVKVYRTYNVKRGINGTSAAAHAAKAASRYIPPYDINWLCRQIAGLMAKKAEGHFAGKVGNAELGEVFYMDEFPAKPLARIKQNYRVVRL